MDNQRAVCKMEEDFVKCRANLTMEFPTTGLRSGLWTAAAEWRNGPDRHSCGSRAPGHWTSQIQSNLASRRTHQQDSSLESRGPKGRQTSVQHPGQDPQADSGLSSHPWPQHPAMDYSRRAWIVLGEVEKGFAKLRPRTNPTLEFPMAGLMSGEWSPAKVLVIQNEALKPIHLLIEARHIVHEGVPRNVDPGRHQQPQDQPRNQAGRRPADVDARPSPQAGSTPASQPWNLSNDLDPQCWTAQLVSSGQDHPASQGLRLDCLRINTNLPMPWWTLIQVDDLFANLDFCFFFAFYFSNLEGKSVFLCWSWSFWNLLANHEFLI